MNDGNNDAMLTGAAVVAVDRFWMWHFDKSYMYRWERSFAYIYTAATHGKYPRSLV